MTTALSTNCAWLFSCPAYINLSNTFIGGNLPLSWVSGNTSSEYIHMKADDIALSLTIVCFHIRTLGVLDVHNSEVEGTIQIEKESSKELGE